MNCSQAEKLFDAYLDDELNGALRLEFDAHLVRCPSCQRMLALLETIGDVVAADHDVPRVAADFVDRVVQDIAVSQQAQLRRQRWRRAVLGIVALQAAAVVAFIWILPQRRVAPAVPAVQTPAVDDAPEVALEDLDREALKELVLRRAEDMAFEWHAAGVEVTSNFKDMLRYANLMVPDEVLKNSEGFAVNPLLGIFEALVPGEAPEPEPVVPDSDVHSI